MVFEIRNNSGALFKNLKKTNDNHPNATGTALIGGIKYYVSAWTKEGGTGKFQSLAFKPVDNKPENKDAITDDDVQF